MMRQRGETHPPHPALSLRSPRSPHPAHSLRSPQSTGTSSDEESDVRTRASEVIGVSEVRSMRYRGSRTSDRGGRTEMSGGGRVDQNSAFYQSPRSRFHEHTRPSPFSFTSSKLIFDNPIDPTDLIDDNSVPLSPPLDIR
eukprot:GHVN01017834.1.p1 GENE.GHVN01017834.1~~GHVN01017834.1.p1  ORF type:complete len:140 (+),score=66.61 GHVN01017834.1:306-725(+)